MNLKKAAQDSIDYISIYYSGVDQRISEKEGVGIIVSEEANRKIINYNFISYRIISITTKLSRTINIIQIYSPTDGTEYGKRE